MRTTDELRAALTTLERHAPRAEAVLRDCGRTAASRRRRRTSGLVAVLAGTAAAAVALTMSASATRPAHHRTSEGGRPAAKLTARDVLLTAAVNAAKAPATGKYWRLSVRSMVLLGAGTQAHPYNIADYSTQQNWDPRSAARRSWIIVRDHGARPATPADLAAWRLAGSPISWQIGAGFKTAGSAARAWWQPGSGDVGYLGGAVTAARLRALPASLAGLAAVMRKAAAGRDGIFNVGVQLLQDPVTPQVRANVYRVLASLPGVRLTGITTDPLGRPGRGVALPGSGTEQVLVISPATGELLSEELVVTARGRHTGATDYAKAREGCKIYQVTGVSKATQLKAAGGLTKAQCAPFGFYAVQRHGQLRSYDVYTHEGWTNASPVLPGKQLGPGASQG